MMATDKDVQYFIAYTWRSPGSIEWIPENDVIVGEPVEWLLRRRRQGDGFYRLTFAMPITREQYENWRGALT